MNRRIRARLVIELLYFYRIKYSKTIFFSQNLNTFMPVWLTYTADASSHYSQWDNFLLIWKTNSRSSDPCTLNEVLKPILRVAVEDQKHPILIRLRDWLKSLPSNCFTVFLLRVYAYSMREERVKKECWSIWVTVLLHDASLIVHVAGASLCGSRHVYHLKLKKVFIYLYI